MDVGYIWVLAALGIVVLGLVIAYSMQRWTRYREHRTPEEKRRSDQATRRAFEDDGPD